MRQLWVLVLCLLWGAPAVMAENLIPSMLQSYQTEGAGHFSASAGEKLWKQEHEAPEGAESPKPRNCQTCHGVDLSKPGEHVRTGKVIDPMALSVNPQRFSDVKKIKKWFRRNCKWVLGRVCTAQEKGDILTYLQQQ